MTRHILQTRALVTAAAVATVAAVACSGPPAGATAPDTPVSVTTAVAAGTYAGEVTVEGFLIADGRSTRMCEAAMESHPPQCGGGSVDVAGLDITTVGDTRSEGGVTWADRATVTGTLADGVLTVSG